MDFEGKQSLPTSGSGNSELGTEAVAELVRKVVEEVLDTKIKEIRETLQVGCLECVIRVNAIGRKEHALDAGHGNIELKIAKLILVRSA
ncbi:hypothetical protein PVK06_008245 [Gossypium arboreum]|uniref:Uncharacterized protein n=1 Tax=Gossypium arboreum TaxID=29729 RepID=A0ABR0QKP0_GOSAR|nr:hypothetical protein PVK06_008245 [Gossypium arboreum]